MVFEDKNARGRQAPDEIMESAPQEVNIENALNNRGQTIAQQFFERRLSDLSRRIQNEPSLKLSFSRYRTLVSFSHFTKDEGREILSILEQRGIVHKNCVCIHILPFHSSKTLEVLK